MALDEVKKVSTRNEWNCRQSCVYWTGDGGPIDLRGGQVGLVDLIEA